MISEGLVKYLHWMLESWIFVGLTRSNSASPQPSVIGAQRAAPITVGWFLDARKGTLFSIHGPGPVPNKFTKINPLANCSRCYDQISVEFNAVPLNLFRFEFTEFSLVAECAYVNWGVSKWCSVGTEKCMVAEVVKSEVKREIASNLRQQISSYISGPDIYGCWVTVSWAGLLPSDNFISSNLRFYNSFDMIIIPSTYERQCRSGSS